MALHGNYYNYKTFWRLYSPDAKLRVQDSPVHERESLTLSLSFMYSSRFMKYLRNISSGIFQLQLRVKFELTEVKEQGRKGNYGDEELVNTNLCHA